MARPRPLFVLAALLALGGAGVSAEAPRLRGEPVARLSVTLAREGDAVLVPGPFAVLPGGARVAIDVPEADGILLVEGERIVHHFPLPSDVPGFDELAASAQILVAGRRPRGWALSVDLFVFDLATGRFVERIQSGNPYLRPPDEGLDRWRVLVDGERVGVFDPKTAATYPLWDRAAGLVASADQVVRSTAGFGFAGGAAWIPNSDGSVDRKVRGRAEPFSAAGEGEFVGSVGTGVVVLLVSEAGAERLLPRELVVRVLEGEHAISELRLDAVSASVDAERRVLPGRPVHVVDGKLYWARLGPDYLEVRTAPLPSPER
jgi:hypothetical protein